MSITAIGPGAGPGAVPSVPHHALHAVVPSPALHAAGRRLLAVYVVAMLVVPADEVFPPLGASGYVGSMAALVVSAFAGAMFLRGAERTPNPLRAVLVLFWLVTLASYLNFHLSPQDFAQTLAADRWLLLLLEVTGVILVAGWCLTSVEHVTALLRTTLWAGAFCGLVAGLQFWFSLDVTAYLREIPGLMPIGEEFGIQARGALNRVAGTAIHPIELGTTTALLLPFALHMVLFDEARARWRRMLPFVLLAVGIPASVSRSGVLAVSVSLGVYMLCLPAVRRVQCLVLTPVAVSAVFVSTPGLIGTLLSFFTAGTSDPSILTRVSDYPLVERRVQRQPLLGGGGGTFIPQDVFQILDNQYLKTAIELGLPGLVALVAYLVVPLGVALRAWRRACDPVVASLSAAGVGATASALTSLFAFDAFSFPMFTGIHALVVGLCAACGVLAARSRSTEAADQEDGPMQGDGQVGTSPGGGSATQDERGAVVPAGATTRTEA